MKYKLEKKSYFDNLGTSSHITRPVVLHDAHQSLTYKTITKSLPIQPFTFTMDPLFSKFYA